MSVNEHFFIFQQLNFTGFRKILKKHDKVQYASVLYLTMYKSVLAISFRSG